MRHLTMQQMNDQHGGTLPPDAVLIPDDGAAKLAPKKRAARRPARGARFEMLNTFADVALAGLTGAETKVWLILFRDTKAATGTARTGQTDIARRAGLQPRTVRRALAGLEATGLVTMVRRGRLNAGPSVYRVFAGRSNLK